MLSVVIRTCDKHSLASERIVNKKECVLRCLNSILNNLVGLSDTHLHIIDDNSSDDLRKSIQSMVSHRPWTSIDFLPPRENAGESPKKKTRHSMKVALDLIRAIPEDRLVYLVEDDYLHFPNSIQKMVEVWKYLTEISPSDIDIGIFPQDFNQLYYHPNNPFNQTYVTPCFVLPTPHGYYRTTWFTQESFLVKSEVFHKYKAEFDSLLTIGDNEGNWEGNTISNIWQNPKFKMLMPLYSLVIHMSKESDIPNNINKQMVKWLWDHNVTMFSDQKDSQLRI